MFSGDEVKYTENGWLALVLIAYDSKTIFHLDSGWKPSSFHAVHMCSEIKNQKIKHRKEKEKEKEKKHGVAVKHKSREFHLPIW